MMRNRYKCTMELYSTVKKLNCKNYFRLMELENKVWSEPVYA